MLSSKKLMIVLGLLVIASMVLAACQPAATTEPETIVETVVVTVETEGETVVQVVTPTPEPVDLPDTLVICMGQEPETLYNYGGSMLAQTSILESIYEGGGAGYDSRSFAYQPIILEKLPSLADGDAVLNQVTVGEGARVTDVDGNVITLDAAADPVQRIKVSGATEASDYTGGDVTMDQIVSTFKMLPGLMWSDGTPLTSADSVYSFNLVLDPDTPTAKFTAERTESYVATDDVTVVWTGVPGYRDSLYYINFYGPYPEHIWGQYTAAELLEAVDADPVTNLIGYGPYQMVEYALGENVRMVKNPNYFRAGEGLPKFENLVYRFVGENSNASIASLLAGECDILDQTTGLDNQSELLLELQAGGQLDATFTTGTTYEHVDFGIQHISYDDGSVDAGDRPDFFSDLRVRQGLTMCMDRQAVVDTITFGQSIVIDVYIPPNHPIYTEDVTSYAFDPAAGMALLAEAGWTDTDGDGFLDKDGVKMSLNFETTNATLRQQTLPILADSLAGCGVETITTFYPAGEWFADGPEGKLFGRRFDLGEFAWLTGVDPACNLYLSSQTPGDPANTWVSIMDQQERSFGSGWGGQNNTGFANTDFDTACNNALNSLPGEPAYEENHQQALRLFSELLPVAPLFLRLKLAATRPDMCNFFMDPTNNSEMWNLEEFGYGPLCDG
jgi:peptide/nickel transport system substrate-binding protein